MPVRYSLRQLDYLIAVADTGSVAAAAERVKVSAPSISVAIGQLEAELGLALFLRRPAQGMALTQAGRQVVDQARRVLAEAERLGGLAAQIGGSVRGPLHVGCLLTFAQIVLPHLRRGFVAAHPEVEMRQRIGDQADLIAALRSARIDVALTYDLAIPPDLEFLPLVALPAHAILPADHPLAGRASVGPADLADLPMVLLDLPLSADYFLSAFAAAGLRPRIAERTRDIGVMRSLVANGFGYSIGNIRPHGDAAPDGRPLAFVPIAGALRPMKLGLALAEGAGAVLTIRAFTEHCRAAITPEAMPGLRARPAD